MVEISAVDNNLILKFSKIIIWRIKYPYDLFVVPSFSLIMAYFLMHETQHTVIHSCYFLKVLVDILGSISVLTAISPSFCISCKELSS